MRLPLLLLLPVFGLFLASCATLPSYNPPFTTPAVKADPYGFDPAMGGMGQLQVFTATTQATTGDGYVKQIPQNYRLQYPDGTERNIVNNVYGDPSSVPQIIALPPGQYTVQALADIYRNATVPVVITAGNKTVVNLSTNGYMAAPPPPAQAVMAPDGYIVGWRAD